MNIIKMTNDLAEILELKKLSYIRVKEGETEIEVGIEAPQVIGSAPVNFAPVAQSAVPAAAEAASASESAKASNIVKSPIIGTFYAAPAPDKPPFVKVGDKVSKGQVICIVESMKLMNEITSDFDGTVKEILVSDASPVEFDQDIMIIG